MSAGARAIALIAGTLPARVRARYREEWLADLEGAGELGLPRTGIIGGAIITAVSLDRGDPAITGLPRATLAGRRARWAAGLLGAAVVLGVGLFVWGGYRGFAGQGMLGGEALAAVGTALQVAAIVLVVLGAVMALAAVVHAASHHRRLVVVGLLALPIGITALVGMMLVVPLLGFLGALVGAAVLLVVSASAPRDSAATVEGARRRRVLLALPWSLLTLAAVATGVAHITVWNPLARVRGLSLDEIYAEMAAANEGTGAAFIAGWAVIWSLAAIALPVLCALPALRRTLTARRIAVIGLLTLGATVFFQWFAGFSMGMGMADTFATTGGDAAISGPVLTIVGQLALVAAILIGLAPARRPVPAPA